MANLAVTIKAEGLRVAPGSRATFTVEVTNIGAVVDRYTCEILGIPTSWWSVSPPALELFPERDRPTEARQRSDVPPATGSFTVAIHPPRSPEARAGVWPIGARVSSEHDPASRTVEEASVEVLPFGEIQAELLPSLVSARRTANTQLRVSNQGNRPESISIAGSDKAKALQYGFVPPTAGLEPGADALVKTKITSSKWLWLGSSTSKAYTIGVAAASEDTAPVSIPGTFTQVSVIPPSMPRILATLAAFALAAFAIWQLLVKPQISDAANAAAKDAVAPVQSQVAALASIVAPANSAAASASAQPTAGPSISLPPTPKPTPPPTLKPGQTATPTPPPTPTPKATPTPAPTPTPTGPPTPPPTPQPTPPPGVPTSFAGVFGDPETTSSAQFPIPGGQTFLLTDLFITNTHGDGGLVTLSTSGRRLMQWNAADFRNLDEHFVTGIPVSGGDALVLTLQNCQIAQATGASGNPCQLSVLVTGTLAKAQ